MGWDYTTILVESNAIFEEKKSKFISYVCPIMNEKDAVEYIEKIRSKHWDASHNVYAYSIINHDNPNLPPIQRFTDDGEPQGTAGIPVLEVIKKNELQNLIIVITRYFGGTLLGSSGLVRAYSKSATRGIEASTVVKKIYCREIRILADYNLSGKLQNMFISQGHNINNINYSQDVEFVVSVPIENVQTLVSSVTETSFGRAIIELDETKYITVDLNGKLV